MQPQCSALRPSNRRLTCSNKALPDRLASRFSRCGDRRDALFRSWSAELQSSARTPPLEMFRGAFLARSTGCGQRRSRKSRPLSPRCAASMCSRRAEDGAGVAGESLPSGDNQIAVSSFAVIVYLKLSGSRQSRRTPAASPCGYIRKPSLGLVEPGSATSCAKL